MVALLRNSEEVTSSQLDSDCAETLPDVQSDS